MLPPVGGPPPARPGSASIFRDQPRTKFDRGGPWYDIVRQPAAEGVPFRRRVPRGPTIPQWGGGFEGADHRGWFRPAAFPGPVALILPKFVAFPQSPFPEARGEGLRSIQGSKRPGRLRKGAGRHLPHPLLPAPFGRGGRMGGTNIVPRRRPPPEVGPPGQAMFPNFHIVGPRRGRGILANQIPRAWRAGQDAPPVNQGIRAPHSAPTGLIAGLQWRGPLLEGYSRGRKGGKFEPRLEFVGAKW